MNNNEILELEKDHNDWKEKKWINYISDSIQFPNRKLKRLQLDANIDGTYRVMLGGEVESLHSSFLAAWKSYEDTQNRMK